MAEGWNGGVAEEPPPPNLETDLSLRENSES